jgi:hypothetical protein
MNNIMDWLVLLVAFASGLYAYIAFKKGKDFWLV